ncbi:hypothetical protein [Falsiroseomonas sp. HW251]|uniref:hypothetical protein n=1 Tax=Falsiroseomonas sp. HW251 TaxID=3390998 RepID=UPI003D31F9A9
MHLDIRLERALERVELVTGVGTRDAGRMCVMSLVACLAGEEHTDSPGCASPLIRAFAIPLNDNMPHAVRQRLKPFAPRILGTQDGMDTQRAELLRRALAEEVLPRLGGRQPPQSRRFAGPLWRFWAILGMRRLEREAEWMMDRAVALSDGADLARAIAAAGAVGRLLARAAREAPDPKEADRLWDLAIGLLDRLCDVGGERVAPSPAWAQRLEKVFEPRAKIGS